MSELPKRELALAGVACAVCCAPLVVGAVAAAPVAAAAAGGIGVVAGTVAIGRRVKDRGLRTGPRETPPGAPVDLGASRHSIAIRHRARRLRPRNRR